MARSPFVPVLAGHAPPPLPEGPREAQALRAALVAIEAEAHADPRGAYRLAEALERSGVDPALAAAYLALLPLDLGEVPPDGPDPAHAKTAAQRRALDALFMARIAAQIARERTFTTLQAIVAHDLSLQEAAFAALVPGDRLSDARIDALLRAPTLTPPVAAYARAAAVARPPTERSGAAIAAAFRQGWADALLWPCVDARATMDDHHLAKRIVEIGSSHGFFAQDPEAVRPRLIELAKLGDLPYDWRKGDEGRAPLQLGFAAREALDALAPPPPPPPTARTKDPKKPTLPTPVDRRKLRTPAAREAAFDALGAFVVDALADADDARAREVIAAAISAFYDVREAADQPRGEYAGHFFLVDAVGLDDTGRPVPWDALRARVGHARIEALTALFSEVEREVR